MIEYFFLFSLYFFLFVKIELNNITAKKKLIKNLNFFILLLLIGFRDGIGGDAEVYDLLSDHVKDLSLYNSIVQFDKPLFTFLMKVSSLIFSESDVFTYNFIFGLIFTILLHRFCLYQKNYFFCMFFSLPIVIVLMGMGFISQGISQLIAWQALINLNRRSTVNILIIIFIAFLFHNTSVIFLLILIPRILENLKLKKINYKFYLFLLIFLTITALFLDDYSRYKYYLSYESSSKGLQVRLLFFSIFYFIYLYFIKLLEKNNFEYSSLFKIFFPIILFFSAINFLFWENNYSVVFDRLIMYLYFLPLITCDRLIYYFRRVSQKILFGGAIFIISITYFTVWSIFSNYAGYWIPYKSTILNIF